MKTIVAYNADATPATVIVKGIFKKRYYQIVPGVGLVHLKEEEL